MEVLGICPACKSGKVRKGDKMHKCSKCGFFIWADIHGHKLSDMDLRSILEQGKTEIINFRPVGKSEFKARLVIKNEKVTFEYLEKRASPQGKKEYKSPDEIFIRVESELSGKSSFEISSEPASVYKELSFGIVASRAAECYSLITALKYISHVVEKPGGFKVRISMNSLDFSKYILKESAPRDKDMKKVLYEYEERKDNHTGKIVIWSIKSFKILER